MLNKQITAQLIANAFNCTVVLFFVFRSWCTDGNVCITPFIFEAAAEVIVATVHGAGTAFTGYEIMAVFGFDFITADIASNGVFDNHYESSFVKSSCIRCAP